MFLQLISLPSTLPPFPLFPFMFTHQDNVKRMLYCYTPTMNQTALDSKPNYGRVGMNKFGVVHLRYQLHVVSTIDRTIDKNKPIPCLLSTADTCCQGLKHQFIPGDCLVHVHGVFLSWILEDRIYTPRIFSLVLLLLLDRKMNEAALTEALKLAICQVIRLITTVCTSAD